MTSCFCVYRWRNLEPVRRGRGSSQVLSGNQNEGYVGPAEDDYIYFRTRKSVDMEENYHSCLAPEAWQNILDRAWVQ